jgi:hypothetical protein
MRNVVEFLFWGVIAVVFVLPLCMIIRFLTKPRW